MNQYYDYILDVYKECCVISLPFDCISLLKMKGYVVHSYSYLKTKNYELWELCRKYSDDAFCIQGTNIIAYNDNAPGARIRFSLMHELGHIVLQHDNTSAVQEDEADYFASCILAPRIIVHQLNSAKKNHLTADDIRDYFNISITAANRVIIDYHKWYDNIAHTTRKPTDAELKIKELFCIDKTDTKPNVAKKKTRYSKRYEEYARKSILLQQYGYEPEFYSIYDE